MEIVERDLPQLIVALDSLNDDATYVHILDAKENTNYYCPCCKGIVKPRAYKKDKNYQVQAHYYHETGGCNEETFVHYICKTWLFEKGCKFIVDNVQYEVENIEIEKTLHTSFGDYRPDIIVATTNDKIFYFEIKTTNKKTELYAPKWDELGNDVVEVDTRYFINQKYKNDIPVFNLIYSDGECFIKNYSRNDYEDIIAKRKLEWKRQDKLNYKIQWERLDWFWNILQEYYIGNKTIEDVCNSFSILEFNDQKFICSKLKSGKHKQVRYELENYYVDKKELKKVKLQHITNTIKSLNKEFGYSTTSCHPYLHRKDNYVIFDVNYYPNNIVLKIDECTTENDVYNYFHDKMKNYYEINKEEILKRQLSELEHKNRAKFLRDKYDLIFKKIKNRIDKCKNGSWKMDFDFFAKSRTFYYSPDHYTVSLRLAKYWEGYITFPICDIENNAKVYDNTIEDYIILKIKEEMDYMLKSAFIGKRTVRLLEVK